MIEIIQPYIELAGFTGIAWYLLKSQTNQMKELTIAFKKISNNIGKTLLDSEQTIMIFKAILHEHIGRKVSYCKDILIKNNIFEREETIKKNIENNFRLITSEECNKLSTFNTPAGDLGVLLSKLDREKFLGETFNIIFTKAEVELKVNDLKSLMVGYVNEYVTLIESKMRINTI